MENRKKLTNKRELLVAAAVKCFHQTGYTRVTLDQIATEANVPLGNVYYYFKTKAAIAEAVVQAWQERSESVFTELNAKSDPQRRLLALLRRSNEARAIYTEFGCPLANLARDLRVADEPYLSNLAKDVYAPLYAWSENQFRQLGYSKPIARTHSQFLVANMQGAILMAHASQDETLLTEQIKQLKKWLENLTQEAA